MRKLACIFTALTAIATIVAAPRVAAGPTEGGFASDNVEYVGFFPFEVGTATGASIVGKYMYVTSWKTLSIYDVSDPTNPQALTIPPVPLGFQFENEDVSVSPDGKLLLFSESAPQDVLHVWDVADKSNPVELAQLPGAGDHTSTCILNCRWVYGSDGHVTDLRDPENPRLTGHNWHKLTGLRGGAHDVEEYRNGFVVTSPIEEAFQVLDVRNPVAPEVLGQGAHPNPLAEGGFLFHSGRWPNKGRDRFILMQGEENFSYPCDPNSDGPFMTFDTKGWKRSKSFKLVDRYAVTNGIYADGNAAVNALGCSAHWFEEHPSFENGGLVAIGYYEHGTRFVKVSKSGMIREKGWFVPLAGDTSATYWASQNIVYAVDYTRGIDILRYAPKAS